MTGLKLRNLNMAVAVAGILAAATACSLFGGGEKPAPALKSGPRGPAEATQTPPTASATPQPGPDSDDGESTGIDALIALLRSAGTGLERLEVDRRSAYRDLPYAYLAAGNTNLAITQYPSRQFAMAEAASMRFDTQESGVRITWTGDPPTSRTHVFVIGELLVKYNGDDPVALDVLVSAGGRLMAGGDYGAMAHSMPRIVAYLKSQGHEVTLPGREPDDPRVNLFDRRSDTILVNGQPLHIFDLRPLHGSHGYLRSVSADGLHAH